MARKLVSIPEQDDGETGQDESASRQSEVNSMASTAGDGATAGSETTPGSGATSIPKARASNWVEKIKESIPIEVLTAWIAIHALLTVGNRGETVTGYWAVFGVVLVAAGLYTWLDVEVPDSDKTTWQKLSPWEKRVAVGSQVALAMGAFVVWAVYLLASASVNVEQLFFLPGDTFDIGTRHATILLVVYTLLGPQLVPQLVSKFLGVRLRVPDEATGDAPEDGTSG